MFKISLLIFKNKNCHTSNLQFRFLFNNLLDIVEFPLFDLVWVKQESNESNSYISFW